MNSKFRSIPSVDSILADARLQGLIMRYPHSVVVEIVRNILEQCRRAVAGGKNSPSSDEVIGQVLDAFAGLEQPGPHRLINATGVILHTNLGRAPFSTETAEAMRNVAPVYCDLEYDIPAGKRGSRHTHLESLLCRITGAEAALAVNNNAAAVLVTLSALAKRKEVIVSRGQAVQIGGGFRIPDVMRQSGAKLVEVGTTNCTYLQDFEQALTERTTALMQVHSSNFRQVGFTDRVTLRELAELAKRQNLMVFDDLGSGCLLDVTKYGLMPEPTIQESVTLGASIATFSGDKLLGGPQAGIIVGKKELVDRIKKHPLVRAIRIDKVRIAGLTATCLHYLRGEAEEKIPVWRMIATSVESIGERAQQWADELGSCASVIDGESTVGGGSLPGSTLPTRLVAITAQGFRRKVSAETVARVLREQAMPIIGRISEDTLLLDPRTVLPDEDGLLLKSVKAVLNRYGG